MDNGVILCTTPSNNVTGLSDFLETQKCRATLSKLFFFFMSVFLAAPMEALRRSLLSLLSLNLVSLLYKSLQNFLLVLFRFFFSYTLIYMN